VVIRFLHQASVSDEGNATPPCGESTSFQRLSFPRDSGCYASNENLHRSSPAASDRSFHSGSQTESGIHLANDDEVKSQIWRKVLPISCTV